MRTQSTGGMERQLPLQGGEQQTDPAHSKSLLGWPTTPCTSGLEKASQTAQAEKKRKEKLEKKIRNHMKMKTSISF